MAMTYIDRNVEAVMRSIQKRDKPAVVMFFSDHGESPYTNRGHEPSQFIDEMTTVPFVLYFNAAYRAKYPVMFAGYQAEAHSNNIKFLDQIVPTVLDILSIESKYPLSVPSMRQAIPHNNPVIMERETLRGASSLDFRYDEKKGFVNYKFSGGTPEPTLISIINDRFKEENAICYHRSDSVAKALRAASVAGCIEFDLVVNGEKLSIYHPPATATGFELEHIFAIASSRKNKLWIDSKNLNEPAACQKLLKYLEKNRRRVGEILVEFPENSVHNINELNSCAMNLRKLEVRTSYYVPTHLLLPCAKDLVLNNADCSSLNAILQQAIKSGIFTDLSFDFLGYSAMQKIKGADKLAWNTWAVNPLEFHKFPRHDFRYIIMDTSTDPNTY